MATAIQHGMKWSGQDITGWYASEKMDGCRGVWESGKLWSRSGRRVLIPAAWARGLPRMTLEGEIWAGRGQFSATSSAVVNNVWAPHVCFMVFDAPASSGDWADRIQAAAAGLEPLTFAAAVPWSTIESLDHAARWVRAIRLGGGEGLILHRPGAEYRGGRTSSVLKLKCDPITGELQWRERRIWRRRRAA